MGKLESITIIFDHVDPRELPVFHPGQVVTGTVLVRTRDTMHIKGIRLMVYGEGIVTWSEHTGYRQRTTFYNRHEYINVEDYLVGSRTGGNQVPLSIGDHRYPFTFLLPHRIPSSFSCSTGLGLLGIGLLRGAVHYQVKVTFEQALKFDIEIAKPIRVAAVLDLNILPSGFKSRTIVNNDIDVRCYCGSCCCCCTFTGGLETVIRPERRCYVPGETIFFDLDITNYSSSVVTTNNIELCQHLTFVHARSIKTADVTVAYVDMLPRDIPPGETESWTGLAITVPPGLPPTDLGGSTIIKLQYLMKVRLSSACSRRIILSVELLIGSVPLRDPDEFSQNVHTDTLEFDLSRANARLAEAYRRMMLVTAISQLQRQSSTAAGVHATTPAAVNNAAFDAAC